jgi:UDP-N-acetylmuramate--L-alanine ligase/UDP-N-acetylenolpyruvoylglucosamine reductase
MRSLSDTVIEETLVNLEALPIDSPPVATNPFSTEQLASFLSQGDRRIHLIGVAGSGMSGIAGLLMSLEHRVSGCDRSTTDETARLQGTGLDFYCPHTADPLIDAELVIYSSAIKPGNLAYDAAVAKGVPMVRRAEALAAIMAIRDGVVVCGTHGKTTTSSMSAYVLRAGGLNPSHYVGAEIPILGTNAHWNGAGRLFVAEGDESDGTLRLYRPAHAIVLNIEEEHLDHYSGLAEIEAVFSQLQSQTRGWVIYCADDPVATRVCRKHPGAVSYGMDPASGADYTVGAVKISPFESEFEVIKDGEVLGTAALHIPGRHNISNALAVIALATQLEIPFPVIAAALSEFRGAKRRFEKLHEGASFRVVDDYGHHPTEIKATLSAARNAHPGRLVVMFQPHRYTRTKLLLKEFTTAFNDADVLFLTEIYPASEPPIPGVNTQMLVDAIWDAKAPIETIVNVPTVADLPKAVAPVLRAGDMLISLGAGNVHEAAKAMLPDMLTLEKLMEIMGPGQGRLHEPMSKHTTLRVGGPAQFWLQPETEAGFAALVRHCRATGLPIMVTGRGSNLLVRDGGIKGVVVHLGAGEFAEMSVEGETIRAAAGVKFKEVAARARKEGIGGFEWMEGIPGAVGGGLRMNAGAMGGETFRQVLSVRLIDETGDIVEKTPDQLEVRYRSVPSLNQNFALGAVFRGETRDADAIEALMDASKDKRKSSQPVAASAGCTFKNPTEIPAGKLVDELGLKNLSVGAAKVSEVHGNFIINEGGASAGDVLALIRAVQDRAWAERGIRLEPEVRIVGEETPYL